MSNTTKPHKKRAHHAGIDVSKARLDVCFLLPEGETFSVANDTEGIEALLQRLREVSPELLLVVMEASGKYERPAAAAIAALGIAVAVVNPRQARDFAS